ncbi:nuclear transport factor 2 family protein [Thiomicrospira microaerophila]|uniref:nuclear transport factor 2 family protein n=1 Tax=Thiomicrospira microaerophila TaxID=406020 RepID=UPI0005CAFE33|nr:nuclear transport factor 2 family protein [Thiomicrospira microaerophila]
MSELKKSAKIKRILCCGWLVGALAWGANAQADEALTVIQTLIGQKQFTQAASMLLTAEDLSDYQKTYLEGWLALQKQQPSDALEIWQALHLRYPEQLILGNNLAVLQMQQGLFDQAQATLEQSLHADREISKALENLNKIYSYQAQKAYSSVFRRVEAKTPVGEMLALTESNSVVTIMESDFDGQPEVLRALEAWRAAWSAKNVQAYLAAYHADFVPANNQSLAAWRSARARSLSAPRFIEVFITDLQLLPIDAETVRVQFTQRYRSDRFQDEVVKVLLLKSQASEWKIIQETVINEI